ncbi:MAG TPA: DUF4954 family protein [Flavisolibacter sp.]|nr:DUF4954 family protein [Flavisolibacter sp.]
MNEVRKIPLKALGYNFIPGDYLPADADEYHLRNLQNQSGINYRNLNAYEIEVLVRNRNTSDDWNKLQVSDAFDPELVKACKFYGLVRIGKLEAIALQYHNVCFPVGLYNSTIISCDFGDNVVVNNVTYISHYIIGNEVMLANIHELHVTDHAKFGNGILKSGEEENVRVWIEVCNENAGRKILPFDGMLPGDAYLWSKYRDDRELMERFKEFTEKKFDRQRGYYGKIGDRTVIKNTSIIKDVWVGSDAYIKGANKLKNLTINSSPNAPSQIGEGCELVNGIIDYGCRVFYGVKAVRFHMASHSQLKYGARLINSYLGNNSTISCCEVLNSLIYPAHEQHHNNSFLCASLVMGQSNIAAGVTIGSNHNSRAADGEIVAGRGFWPGLCVSLKHNSKFASYTLIAKGDYSNELNIQLPFSLVSNDVTNNRLVIMPAYWFMYNMYALERNANKYVDRDRRTNIIQHIEYDYLAPDSIDEIFTALRLLQTFTVKALQKKDGGIKEEDLASAGEAFLDDPLSNPKDLDVVADEFENGNRTVHIVKSKEAYRIYKQLIAYYSVQNIVHFIEEQSISSFENLSAALPKLAVRTGWHNIGGQLMPVDALTTLLDRIRAGDCKNWNDVHDCYQSNSSLYKEQKLQHAFASLLTLLKINGEGFTAPLFSDLLQQALSTKAWMVENIYASREKDYQSEFRQMLYDTKEEMDQVIGKLEENVFIQQQRVELENLKITVDRIKLRFSL